MRRGLASLGAVLFVVGVWGCAQSGAQTTTGDDAGIGDDASASADSGGDASVMGCTSVCTGTTPFCDEATHACVACLPSNDTCPSPTFCDSATHKCIAGCKTVADCAGDAGT